MIGYIKKPTGRLGNQLLHFLFLRQISKKTGVDYFYPETPDSIFFIDMSKKLKSTTILKKKLVLNNRDVLKINPTDFLNFIVETANEGKIIVFNPPFLGEVFFPYLFYEPDEFIKINNKFKKPFVYRNQKITIGIHFRGGDFKQWNPHASLKFEYYKKAIDYCIDYYEVNNIVFFLFTDDSNFSSYLGTVYYLSSIPLAEYYLADSNNIPITDLDHLSQCDVLISSPSTFAIVAGCLGKHKMIIHNKAWLEYSQSRGDIFWMNLMKSENPIYRLWKMF
jgi:hypothetical protein